MVLLAIALIFVAFNDVEANNLDKTPEPRYYVVDKHLLSLLTQSEIRELGQSMVNSYSEEFVCESYYVSVKEELEFTIVFQVECFREV